MNSIKPVAWVNKNLTYVELSTSSTVYGSHTIPLYTVNAVNSMMQELEQLANTKKDQARLVDEWIEVDKSIFDELYIQNKFPHRILYPAAAYEALENERDELKQSCDDLQERFNGIKFIESELRKENDSLNAEVLRLKNELIASLKDWHDMNANHEALQKEVTHWKANHADLKERLHVATHRTDLPSNRLPLFDKMRTEIEALQKELGLAKLALESKRDLLTSCEAALDQSQAENAAQVKLLTEQDYKYNKQTNELIARHAEQLEVAAEFCRQYQIENKKLKAATTDCYEKNLDLNLENFELKAKNNHLQFLLDSVMLEYCPDEMTEEQMENWSKHQKKSNLEIL